MDNHEIYYSLCVTVRHQNNHTELLRLADIIFSKENSGETGSKLYPFNKNSDLSQVKTISMDPFMATPNELCIWKWNLDPDDSNKQYSYRTCEKYYELIFLKNSNINNDIVINPLPIWELFDTLLDGFTVPLQHSNSFLLVVNQTETEYICLEILESSYIVDGNYVKIPENTPLKEYKILKKDVIDTNKYLQNINNYKYFLNPELQRRIIYERRTIWRNPIATLHLKRFNTHLAEYLKQASINISFQKEDIKIIEAFIRNIAEDVNPDSDFMTFCIGYYPQIKGDALNPAFQKFPLLEDIFTSYLKRTTTDKKFISSIVEHIPSLKKKYLQILTENYLEEEKQKLL